MADNKAIEGPTGMSSINRVAKLPVVESTWNVASGMYSKVKESNSFINNMLSTAESTVHSAVQATQPITQPITNKFEGPMKSVDSALCSGLDFVEDKIPGIKLPPQQMYENTKNLVYSTVEPAVKCVCENVQKVSDALSYPCEAGELCIKNKEQPKSDENDQKKATTRILQKNHNKLLLVELLVELKVATNRSEAISADYLPVIRYHNDFPVVRNPPKCIRSDFFYILLIKKTEGNHQFYASWK